jgi:hypothetical protein
MVPPQLRNQGADLVMRAAACGRDEVGICLEIRVDGDIEHHGGVGSADKAHQVKRRYLAKGGHGASFMSIVMDALLRPWSHGVDAQPHDN